MCITKPISPKATLCNQHEAFHLGSACWRLHDILHIIVKQHTLFCNHLPSGHNHQFKKKLFHATIFAHFFFSTKRNGRNTSTTDAFSAGRGNFSFSFYQIPLVRCFIYMYLLVEDLLGNPSKTPVCKQTNNVQEYFTCIYSFTTKFET